MNSAFGGCGFRADAEDDLGANATDAQRSLADWRRRAAEDAEADGHGSGSDFGIAQQITHQGRQDNRRVQAICRERGLRVVYGDTDSVFVAVFAKNAEDARAQAQALAAAINADPTVQGEIEPECELRRFVIGKERKRYAYEDTKGNRVIKGFQAVKGDTPPIAARAQREALSLALDGADPTAPLRAAYDTILEGRLTLDDAMATITLRADDAYKCNRDASKSKPVQVVVLERERQRLGADRAPQPDDKLKIGYVRHPVGAKKAPFARTRDELERTKEPLCRRHYIERLKCVADAVDMATMSDRGSRMHHEALGMVGNGQTLASCLLRFASKEKKPIEDAPGPAAGAAAPTVAKKPRLAASAAADF